MQWDLFCHVVDNFGDVGVCWRLAADLAARGETVRLFVDDGSALAWMAPDGAPGITVAAWPVPDAAFAPGDVVVEAFGCDLPDCVVGAMTALARPPVWINLEYLSAETYVERSHRLASPRGRLTTWFFYPGFTAATGGLLREPDLMRRQAAFDAPAWLAERGVHRGTSDERNVSLFCYDNPALPDLLDALAAGPPTRLLVTAGTPTRMVRALLGERLERGALRATLLPFLPQPVYDELLWACDLNFVRGEDSWVRAQWTGRPFVWQAYPQSDAVHQTKVEAFLDRFNANATLRTLHARWNGAGNEAIVFPPHAPWQALCRTWRDTLLALPDLVSQLIGFAAEKR